MKKLSRHTAIGALVSCTLYAAAFLSPAALYGQEGATCAPPISVCNPDPASPDVAACPAGYRCTCVPSCPNCRDCAARVCLAADEPQCRTACDCEPGLGCFDNQCIAGFAAVYCCEGDICPAGQQCQHEDGTADRCEPDAECRTACDCEAGLACIEGRCIAATDPVYCCEADRCPAGAQCQHRDGARDLCRPDTECRTACDCTSGLACVDGQCLAGFVPVFCCEGEQCPAGDQCQHSDGRMDRCERDCIAQTWACSDDANLPHRGCGTDRVCSCTASCPDCEDCGPNVCVPPGSPTPYACKEDGTCAQAGDRCICVSSCPFCDDCARTVCVPGCEDPMCEKRLRRSQRKINRVIEKTRPCRGANECVRVGTSTECQGSCGAWINRMYAKRVENFIHHVDHRYCGGSQAAGCPYSTPRCINESGACVEGLCTGVPVATTTSPGQ